MDYQRIPISQLQPAPYNPRIALRPGDRAYEKLKRSLEEFDLVQPLVWNRRTGHVVGGHQRLGILRQRGDEEVDCIVVDLPLEREKALNVVLNNQSAAGDWDAMKLVELTEELCALPDFDATLTGFDEDELRDLVFEPAETESVASDQEDAIDGSNVRAVLEVPHERWGGVRARLDDLLAAEGDVALHVSFGRDVPRSSIDE
ncbi:MAG: transcriptional regulator [Planctomycetota bacterium]|nr:MAG: transcriptional regulator [Planctomycetota bacterium]REK25551.1 MAG: transcriptional regulator [Planctomycetota bacterium]REK31737.1 MAG: transcriptional regulator [Planctomycetota bacterium]